MTDQNLKKESINQIHNVIPFNHKYFQVEFNSEPNRKITFITFLNKKFCIFGRTYLSSRGREIFNIF